MILDDFDDGPQDTRNTQAQRAAAATPTVATRLTSSMLVVAKAWHAVSDAASSLVVGSGVIGKLARHPILDVDPSRRSRPDHWCPALPAL